MEGLAYAHSQEAYETANLDPNAYELKLLQGLDWKPASSAWIGVFCALSAFSIMSLADTAMAAYVRTNGSALNIRSAPNGRVVGSIANGATVSLSGETSNGWSQLSNGNWVASRWIRNGNSGGGGGGGSPSGVLRPGSSGSPVTNLQNRLRQLGYFSGSSTGYYGSVTSSAVRRFQAARGLQVDGLAGPRTLAALSGSNNGGGGGGSPINLRVRTGGTPLNVRSGPGLGYRVIRTVGNGSTVRVFGASGGWRELDGGGWVSASYLR